MSALLTTDYLAAEALTICKAAGKADYKVGITDTRLPDGSHAYYVTVHTFLGAEQTIYNDNAEQLLGALAAYLGTSWPLVFATAAQRVALINLYNHPLVSAAEKAGLKGDLYQMSETQAAALLGDGPGSFRQEVQRRQLEKHPNWALAGEAYQVRPAA